MKKELRHWIKRMLALTLVLTLGFTLVVSGAQADAEEGESETTTYAYTLVVNDRSGSAITDATVTYTLTTASNENSGTASESQTAEYDSTADGYTIDLTDAFSDLTEGQSVTISYSISASGYNTKTGTITGLTTSTESLTSTVSFTTDDRTTVSCTYTLTVTDESGNSVTGAAVTYTVTTDGTADSTTCTATNNGDGTYSMDLSSAATQATSSVSVSYTVVTEGYQTKTGTANVVTDGTVSNNLSGTVTYTSDDVAHTLTLTVAESDGGSVSITNSSGSTVLSSAGTYTFYGSFSGTLTVTPAEDYEISSVTVDGTEVTADSGDSESASTYSLSLSVDTTVVVTFIRTYTFTISYDSSSDSSSGYGTITVDPSDVTVGEATAVQSGKTVKVTATPSTGYHVESVTVDDESVSYSYTVTDDDGNEMSYSLGDNDCEYEGSFTASKDYTIVIKFAANTYTITAEYNSDYGTVSVGGSVTNTTLSSDSSLSVSYGTSGVVVYIDPEDGYTINAISINGTSYSVESLSESRGVYQFTLDTNLDSTDGYLITDDTVISVTFVSSSESSYTLGSVLSYDSNDLVSYTTSSSEGTVRFLFDNDSSFTFSVPSGASYIYIEGTDQDGNTVTYGTTSWWNTSDRITSKTVYSSDGIEYIKVTKISLYYHMDGNDFGSTMSSWHEISLASGGVILAFDTTEPTGTITAADTEDEDDTSESSSLQEEFSAGLYSKDGISVSISAADTSKTYNSGVSTIQYYIVENASGILSEDELADITDAEGTDEEDEDGETTTTYDPTEGWVTYDADSTEISYDTETTFVVYAKITDKAGNVTYISSEALVVDLTLPEVTCAFNNHDSTYSSTYFNDTRTLTITVTEENFYTDGVDLTITKDGTAIVTSLTWTENEDGTYTATYEFGDEGDGYYRFSIEVTDLAGNSSGEQIWTMYIDTESPTGTVTATSDEGSTTESSSLVETRTFAFFSKSGITITASGSDENAATERVSGVDTISYYLVSGDDAENVLSTSELAALSESSWETLNSDKLYVDDESQFVVYIRIMDKAGNTTYLSTDGLIVDETITTETIAPVTTISAGNGIYGSGDLDDDGNITVSVDVKDPESNSTYSGIKTVTYTVKCDGEQTASGTLVTYNSALTQTWSGTISIDAEENNSNTVVVSVKATDWAGNSSTTKYSLSIDTTAPTIEVEYDNNDVENDVYFDATRTATIVITERNFDENDVDITITMDGDEIDLEDVDEDVLVLSEWECSDEDETDDETTWTATIKYLADGDYTFDISYTDEAGNEATDTDGNSADSEDYDIYAEGTEAGDEFTIDLTAPEIEIEYDNNSAQNDKYFKATRTLTITITEHNFSSDLVTITQTASCAGETITTPTVSSWTSDGDTHTATIEYDAEGDYTFAISMTDLAGNTNGDVEDGSCTAPYNFTIDLSAPSGTVTATSDEGSVQENDGLVTTRKFAFYSKEGITVTAEGDDDVSAVDTIEYYKVSGDGAESVLDKDDLAALDDDAWTTYSSISVTEDEQFVIYLKITDMAGNVTYISTDGLIVDETLSEETVAPKITTTQPTNEIYSADVKVSISVTDPEENDTYSGLQKIWYTVTSLGEETQSGTLYEFTNSSPTASELEQTWSGSITVSSSLNNSNNVVVTVYALDNAGNQSSEKISLKIDITDPTIEVSYDNNSAENDIYFDAARTATIVITERNFDSDDVDIDITTDDGSSVTISSWTKTAGSGNGDDTTWTAYVYYKSDDDYTFDISYTDLAGNEADDPDYGSSVAPTSFTIDTTSPSVTVTYSNNDASNSTYFSASRTMTITIVEHNFDVDLVTITLTGTLDGSSISTPSVSWSSSGDTHVATIVFDSDGTYTFDFEMTDLAGNANSSINYGSSTATNSFTIDLTVDDGTSIIGGVENGHAYKDEAIPTISFSDINLDSYTITLLRTRKDEIDVDVTEEFLAAGILNVTSQSVSGTFDVFDEIQDNDGIYTLTVSYTDLAGNTVSQTVVFTLNRFGSVYVYGDYLISLIEDGGAYVQAVDGELIITEYNPTQLVEGSLSVEVTQDGKPVDDVEVTVTPVINDEVEVGDSGWYQYEYQISSENFASDGVYKMVISTEDTTGNYPASTNSEYDEILFRVDSTAPEITSITGLEKAIVNATEQEVGYTVYDTIALESVLVYVDGSLVQEIGAEELGSDLNNYSGSIVLSESSNAQTVRLVVTDKAGNVTDTGDDGFAETTAYTFNDSVTISTNFFVRWYANKLLFWGSIVGMALVVGFLLWFFLIFLKRKKDDEEEEGAEGQTM